VKRLCATVLIMEAVVIGLAIPVALTVQHAPARPAAIAGASLAVAAVVLGVLARWRLRWTLIGGSALQVLVIATGAVVVVMYFLGAIFAALWVIGIMLGYRAEQAWTR
jgi:hypothetical protein